MNEDVVHLAQDLIGKVINTSFNNEICSAVITETEAYNGAIDKACHAYGNKRTKRTETMFLHGGYTYVYLCYGIHHLLNIVTGPKEIPTAILIRGIKPLSGLTIMEKRRGRKYQKGFAIGPGKVSQALGITTIHDALPLNGQIWIEDHNIVVPKENINIGPRIGIEYAEEDAKLPYRFWVDETVV